MGLAARNSSLLLRKSTSRASKFAPLFVQNYPGPPSIRASLGAVELDVHVPLLLVYPCLKARRGRSVGSVDAVRTREYAVHGLTQVSISLQVPSLFVLGLPGNGLPSSFLCFGCTCNSDTIASMIACATQIEERFNDSHTQQAYAREAPENIIENQFENQGFWYETW